MKRYEKTRFIYKLPLSSALAMVFATISLTIVMGYIAITVPDSKYIRLVQLISPEAPTYIFGGFSIFCLIASIFTIQFAIRTQIGNKYIELDSMAILVPNASLSMKTIVIPYNYIRSIEIIPLKGTQMLVIKSKVGESRLLEKSFISSNKFTEFILLLKSRCHG